MSSFVVSGFSMDGLFSDRRPAQFESVSSLILLLSFIDIELNPISALSTFPLSSLLLLHRRNNLDCDSKPARSLHNRHIMITHGSGVDCALKEEMESFR